GAFVGSQRVAMDSAGNAVAVWNRSASYRTVWASRFSLGGVGSRPERLASPSDEGPLPQFEGSFPQLTVDPTGNALAAWLSTRLIRPPSVWTVWASRLTQGRWEPAQAIQSPRLEIGGSPSVALSTDGTGLGVWTERQGGVPRLWANGFHPQSGWATAEPISEGDPRGVGAVGVA